MKLLINFISLLWIVFPFLHKTIWFNFKYFPFKIACKLPVLFFSKSTVHLNGKCEINSDNIHMGMIRIGQNFHTNRPNTGVFINIKEGGILRFNGSISVGHSTCIEVGEKGILEIGDNFITTYGALIYAYHYVSIGYNCRLGWDSVVMDTSFHSLKLTSGGKTKGYGSIIIGNNVWIPSFCRVMAGAKIPNEIIFGSGSYIAKDYSDIPPKSLLAGNPLSLKKEGIYRDLSDDTIIYR